MAVIQASGGYYLAKVGCINYTEENSEKLTISLVILWHIAFLLLRASEPRRACRYLCIY